MLCALDFACSTGLPTFHILSREVAKGQADAQRLAKVLFPTSRHSSWRRKLEQVRHGQLTQSNGKRKLKLTLSASLSSCPSRTPQVVAASSFVLSGPIFATAEVRRSPPSSFPDRATLDVGMLSTRSTPSLPLTTGAHIRQNCDPQCRSA